MTRQTGTPRAHCDPRRSRGWQRCPRGASLVCHPPTRGTIYYIAPKVIFSHPPINCWPFYKSSSMPSQLSFNPASQHACKRRQRSKGPEYCTELWVDTWHDSSASSAMCYFSVWVSAVHWCITGVTHGNSENWQLGEGDIDAMSPSLSDMAHP